LENGGKQSAVEKARAAANDTTGHVLTYNGALIEATYFSCSGGRTEDALAVWGTDVPYLKAVDSPGEENAKWYTDRVRFSAAEFATRLQLVLTGSPSGWFGPVTRTSGGGVDTMEIGGVIFKGTELRQRLGLRSTAFSVTVVGELIYVSTKGYGHRVGMSQYGADAMALNGYGYTQILEHYYPGTVLESYLQN
jgi:stage II sporulation protein D